MDALFWGPDWSQRPYDELRPIVDEATDDTDWVVDGNYSRTRDIIWPKADTLVWLDYPLTLIMWRLWWRTLRRVFLRERLWNDNRERFWSQFLTRDSLFLWVLKKYWVYRREYPELLLQPEYSHLAVAHLRSAKETELWLQQLTNIMNKN
jgi:adenylate kinase family enzyme